MRVLDELAFMALSLIPAAILYTVIVPTDPLFTWAIFVGPYLIFCIFRGLLHRYRANTRPQVRAIPEVPRMGKVSRISVDPSTKRGKLFDFLAFVLGPVLLTMGVFSFSHRGHTIEYSAEAVLLIGIGVGLIAYGFLRRQWLRERKGQ